MGIENRPYVGSWRLGQKKVVQWTPDAMVYLNGELTLPSCSRCRGYLDVQKYVTEASCEAGVEPGSMSASFSLSIPLHDGEGFVKDAQTLLKPGLGVTIYFRGYFPIKGLYSNLDAPTDRFTKETSGGFEGETSPEGAVDTAVPTPANGTAGVPKGLSDIDWNKVPKSLIEKWSGKGGFDPGPTGDDYKRQVIAMAQAEAIEKYWKQKYPDAKVVITGSWRDPKGPHAGNHGQGGAFDYRVDYNGGKSSIPVVQTYGGQKRMEEGGRIVNGGNGLYINAKGTTGTSPDQQGAASKKGSPPGGSSGSHLDPSGSAGTKGKPRSWLSVDTNGDGNNDITNTAQSSAWLRQHGLGSVVDYFGGGWKNDSYTPGVGAGVPSVMQELGQGPGAAVPTETVSAPQPELGEVSMATIPPSDAPQVRLPDALRDSGVADVLAYPYYHVFKGVVTQVTRSYSGGVQTFNISCSSELYFWSYHQVCVNKALLASSPGNSPFHQSFEGHVYTGKHPYAIVSSLFYDEMGAPAGMDEALQSKTNIEATSSVTGENFYSIVYKYWEKRFHTKETRLRMHGATGALFNAAQAALLSKLSSKQLTEAVSKRWSISDGTRNDIIRGTAFNALFNQQTLQSLLLMQQKQQDETGVKTQPQGLNMAIMLPFALDVGRMVPDAWESTYETKMEVVQRVMQVTGFEFYQDVDGDFVFKPPMYNLDTSSSRVYRIEDIDIISINVEEKEPDATYIIGRNPALENFKGGGAEGEMGVRAQYIDWRLVAQFGWRGADFETTFIADKTGLFFSAINRLTLLNVVMNSATVVVPLRPEIRPGYPVYIASLDCFYYVHSFSHSYSVGSQCTTTLQLHGRRAKWHAPGRVDKEGIEAIDLGNPALPPKPLLVQDNAGRLRIHGFPNVVMALDPEAINPLYFVTGTDLNKIAQPETLENFVKAAVQLHIIRRKGDDPSVYVIDTGDNSGVELYFRSSKDQEAYPAQGSVTGSADARDLKALASEYVNLQQVFADKMKQAQKSLASVRKRLASAQKDVQAVDAKTDVETFELIQKKIAALQAEQRGMLAGVQVSQSQYEESLSSETKFGLKYLLDLIQQMGQMFGVATGRGWDKGSFSTTISLLDLLSEKKSSLTLSAVPGDYRYYSASHPDRAQQGQRLLKLRTGDVDLAGAEKTVALDSPQIVSNLKGQVLSFVPSPQITMAPGSRKPDATLAIRTPEWGIRTLLSTPEGAKGIVIPTSDITEMMVAAHDVEHWAKNTSTKDSGRARSDAAFRAGLVKAAANLIGTPKTSSTLNQVFAELITLVNESTVQATLAAEAASEGNKDLVPQFGRTSGPDSINIGGSVIPTDVAIGDTYLFADTKGAKEAFPGSSRMMLAQFWKRAAQSYGDSLYHDFVDGKRVWYDALMEHGVVPNPMARKLTDVLNESVCTSFLTKTKLNENAKTRTIKNDLTLAESPILPVTDARGYEVIGSYQYGRGIGIEPEGALDVLRRQDPLSMLDRPTVERIVTAIIQGHSIDATVDVGKTNTGAPVKTSYKVAGSDAANQLEKELFLQLDGKVSDQQLIDLGLAVRTGNPDVLQINLMNWFAEKGKDGIQKIPVNNAAYSLADINAKSGNEVCSCKVADAEVMLDAAQVQDFVQIGEGGYLVPQDAEDKDYPTQWSITQVALAVGQWKTGQDAMRGGVLDRNPSTIVQQFQELGDTYDSLDAALKQKRKAIGESVEAAKAALVQVKPAKDEGT